MNDKIVANSELIVKATAALSKEIAKELADNKQDKNLKEMLDEDKCADRHDGKSSN